MFDKPSTILQTVELKYGDFESLLLSRVLLLIKRNFHNRYIHISEKYSGGNLRQKGIFSLYTRFTSYVILYTFTEHA